MNVSGPIPESGVGPADRGDGPATAFDAFAREQRPALVALAWTLTGDVGVAEDVAQDAPARDAEGREVARNTTVLDDGG
jgi:hypothetical protein